MGEHSKLRNLILNSYIEGQWRQRGDGANLGFLLSKDNVHNVEAIESHFNGSRHAFLILNGFEDMSSQSALLTRILLVILFLFGSEFCVRLFGELQTFCLPHWLMSSGHLWR